MFAGILSKFESSTATQRTLRHPLRNLQENRLQKGREELILFVKLIAQNWRNWPSENQTSNQTSAT
jgi:hypothetical protein